MFPLPGCRFIALSGGVDTIHKSNETLVILKNVMNNLYAQDAGGKIKAVTIWVAQSVEADLLQAARFRTLCSRFRTAEGSLGESSLTGKGHIHLEPIRAVGIGREPVAVPNKRLAPAGEGRLGRLDGESGGDRRLIRLAAASTRPPARRAAGMDRPFVPLPSQHIKKLSSFSIRRRSSAKETNQPERPPTSRGRGRE